MKQVFTFLFLIAMASFLFVPAVFAGTIDIVNPLRAQTFQEFLEYIIGFLFWLGLALAPLFFLVAAFYFMTAGGNPKNIETGKNIIIYTLVGLLIIIMARGAVELIQRMFQ